MTSEHATWLYLVLVGLTAAVCLWQIVRAVLVPAETLGLPLIFCMAFGYFYVFQSFITVTQLGYIMPGWVFELGQAVVLGALLSFLLGWRLGRRRKAARVRRVAYNDGQVFLLGTAAMVVGAFGSTMSYGEVDYKNTSAYVYLSFHFGYPGALLCLQVAARRADFRNPAVLLVPVVLLAVIITPAVVYVRRGPLFPMAIVLMYGYSLTRGRRPNPLLLVAGLVATGVVMLAFVTMRDYAAVGGSWQGRRFEQMSVGQVMTEKAGQVDDNEYLFHCGGIATCWQTGVTDYGTGYLTLFTHWVPREVWPDKPSLGQGILGGDPIPYMSQVVGVSVTQGGSTGGVCEAYCHLGPFSMFLWLGIGYLGGRLYTRAIDGSALSQSAFVALAATSHWLIAQGMPAAFVPGVAYVGVPWLVYSLSRQHADPYGRPR